MRIHEMGGAYVRRRFTSGATAYKPGDHLTQGELAQIPAANRDTLIKNLWIEPYPMPAGSDLTVMIISTGYGKFNVIEGRKLNDKPLTKEEAQELAEQRQSQEKGQVAA